MSRMPRQREPLLLRAHHSWFDPRGRDTGLVAFALNRLTGIGLVVYLALHLIVLSTLTRGEAGWSAFLNFAHSPVVFVLDVALFFGFIYHMLNGIRVSLTGIGIAPRSHKSLFWILMAVGLVALAWVVFRLASA